MKNHFVVGISVTAVLLCAIETRAATPLGECSGNTLTYLDDVLIRHVDCGTLVCGVRDCTDPDAGCIGYDCVGGPGAACTYDLEAAGCDVSQSLGCINAVCDNSMLCDPTSSSSVCNGTVLQSCNQTLNLRDCSSGGTAPFTCGVDSRGDVACLGTLGAHCDLSDHAECAAGLVCASQLCVAPDAGSIACPSVGPLGGCQGTTLTRCELGDEVTVDCAATLGSAGTCGVLDCLDAGCVGHDCVLQLGGQCEGRPCDLGSGLGCISGSCQVSAPCDPASVVPHCSGAVLSTCNGVANEHDCSLDFTGPLICEVSASGAAACAGVAGAWCDPTRAPDCARGFTCDAGFCVGGSDAGPFDGGAVSNDAGVADAGAGDAGSMPDAGRPLSDAGLPSDAGGASGQSGTCGCAAGSTSAGGWLLVLLIAALRARPVRLGGGAALIAVLVLQGSARAQAPDELVFVNQNLGWKKAPISPNALIPRTSWALYPQFNYSSRRRAKAVTAGVAELYTNIPDTYVVGSNGTGPCAGVIIAGDNGDVVVGHFHPRTEGLTEDPASSLDELLRVACLVNPKAYLFSGTTADPDTGEQLRAIDRYLSSVGVPIVSFSPTPALFIDNKGSVYWGQWTKHDLDGAIAGWGGPPAGRDTTKAYLWSAGSWVIAPPQALPTPIVDSSVPSVLIDTTTACGLRGHVQTQCQPAPLQPLARQTIRIVGDTCTAAGVTLPNPYVVTTVTTPGGSVAAWRSTPGPQVPVPGSATPVNVPVPVTCSAMHMEYLDAGSMSQTPIPATGMVDLGLFEVDSALTSVQGSVVTTGTGGALAGADVTWSTQPDGGGDQYQTTSQPGGTFAFPSEWGSCKVDVYVSYAGNASMPVTVPVGDAGVTDVGALVLPQCGTDTSYCAQSGVCEPDHPVFPQSSVCCQTQCYDQMYWSQMCCDYFCGFRTITGTQGCS